MKSKFTPIYTTFLLLFTLFLFLGNSSNPPNGYTGAPGDDLCTNCHTPGNPQGFDGQILIENFPANITPNTAYSLTARVTNPNGLAFRAGFQAVVLNESNNNSGDITTGGSNPTTQMNGGREYVEHNPAINFPGGNEVTWNFTWTSPNGPVGETITIYAAGNIASGGNGNQQDLIVTTNVSGTIISGGGPLEVEIVSSQNVSCNGGNDGSATASASEGTMPYSYNWSNGSNMATANNLIAGMHTVTVTDALNATATAMVTITQPTPLNASITNQSNIDCNNPIGSATAAGSGGTPPYIYSWSSGGNNATETFLNAGLYTVSVIDNNFCLTTTTVTIAEDVDLPVVNAGPNAQLDCNTPIVVLNGSPSGPPYTLLWTTIDGNIVSGETTPNPTVNAAGTYTLTVTDQNNGCSASDDVIVTELDNLSLSINGNNVSCFGENDGNINLTVTGGELPFDFDWNDNTLDGIEDPMNLAAGNYCVTVTDNGGCSATTCLEITEPDLIVLNTNVTNISCFGICDGSIELITTGGAGNFVYEWTGPNGYVATTANITGLCPGEYTVIVTDENNCTATTSVTISEPDPMTVSSTVTPPTCNGECDGIVNLEITGGTPPYIGFIWSNSCIGPNPEDVCAGNFTVTITDNNGCTTVAGVTVTEPEALDLQLSSTNETTPGANDGTATAAVSGGTQPYTYLWDDPASQTTPTATNLAPGTYCVLVTDANGCTATGCVVVNAGGCDLTATVTPVDVLCNGDNDGSAEAFPSGGTLPYSYNWSSGGNEATENNLSAGNYDVTITDVNNCEVIVNFTINEPPDLDLAMSSTNETSNGAMDGTATATASGGTAPYTYLWDDPANQTTPTATNLSPGDYCVTVTDDNGCTETGCVAVNPGGCDLEGAIAVTNVSCNSLDDGSAVVTQTGGTPPYTYAWSSGGTETTEDSLSAGDYMVTIFDSNGCCIILNFTVTEPTPLELIMSSTDETAPGAMDGTATGDVSGGIPGYTESWNTIPEQFGVTITNLSAGIYCVTITDNEGCTISNCTQVNTVGCDLDLSISNNNFTCYDVCEGTINLAVNGGEAPFNYDWSSVSIGNVEDPTDLCPGNYRVTVTDNNGCSFSIATTVEELPDDMVLNFESTPTSCLDNCDGTSEVTVTGGTSPYSFLWNNGDTTAFIDSLCFELYEVTVTDANGCTKVGAPVITVPTSLFIIEDVIHPFCYESCDGSIDISVSDGIEPYDYDWNDDNFDGMEDLTNLCAGMYELTVTDANGCSAVTAVFLDDPDELMVQIAPTDISCFGECDGFVDIIVTGGSGAYTYTGSTNDLCAGNYTATVTDQNACSATADFVITEPSEIVVTIDEISHEMNTQNDGFVNITVMGGVPGYSYRWILNNVTVSTEEDPTGLAAGIYTLEVTDDGGCVVSVTDIIVDNIVGVIDFSLKNSIEIFPNPTSGLLQIDFGLEESQFVKIEIFDFTGKKILTKKASNILNQTLQMDLTTFSGGVYTIKINVGNAFLIERIVKAND